jgi:hypothetical protein
MEPHPLADETLGTMTFAMASDNSVRVTPMMRRRPDGLCNVVVKQEWLTRPSEEDLAELAMFLEPFVRRMTPMELPGAGVALSATEADKVTTKAFMKGDRLH